MEKVLQKERDQERYLVFCPQLMLSSVSHGTEWYTTTSQATPLTHSTLFLSLSLSHCGLAVPDTGPQSNKTFGDLTNTPTTVAKSRATF